MAAEGPLVVVCLVDDAEGKVREERLPVLQAKARRNRVNIAGSKKAVNAVRIAHAYAVPNQLRKQLKKDKAPLEKRLS